MTIPSGCLREESEGPVNDLKRVMLLRSVELAYGLARPIIFLASAQQAHAGVMKLLGAADRSPWMLAAAHTIRRTVFRAQPLSVGGIHLPYPFILAAGFIKGLGFATTQEALAAVRRGENIIPGWKMMPALVGPVEMGSFTRHPRVGNPDVVLWRDARTRSTQNRVGLKNPGAEAAAEFLSAHSGDLPPLFGISVAPTPGITDRDRDQEEVAEAVAAFVNRGIRPSWLTLNLSCPNTEDDPDGKQTAEVTRALCTSVLGALAGAGKPIPLWVKLSPCLSDEQYRTLLRVVSEVGVQAVIATNTVGRPSPSDARQTAGVGGGDLHPHAVRAAAFLAEELRRHRYPVDLIGSGGVQDAATYRRFEEHGIRAVQYWSTLVFRGPLAAALIQEELGA